ncbi:hypothetical protein ES703_26616 [subsurface metagenome]
MVGKPSGRNFLASAALLMITWSSNAWRKARAPESITSSLIPASVSLVVSSASFSTLSAFTASGQEFSLAKAAILSRLASVAA